MLIHELRSHLGGIIAAQGSADVKGALLTLQLQQEQLPELAARLSNGVAAQLEALGAEIEVLEKRIIARRREDEVSRRLATIPGIGPMTASVIVASAPDPILFRSGRQFAAWLGLTPRANSSGGKGRQTGISKNGDGDLGRLLVVGATGSSHSAPTGRRHLDHGVAGTKEAYSGSRGLGQQDGSHRMDADGSEGDLLADGGLEIGPAVRTAGPWTWEW